MDADFFETETPSLVAGPLKSPAVRRDLLLFFLTPAIALLAIHLAFDPTAFEYRVADPTVWGVYTSNLAHRSLGHLGANLVGLAVVVGCAYLLCTAAEYRGHFVAAFFGSLLVVPPFAHLFLQFFLAHQPVFASYEAVGFSQPLAAMVGSLPLALVTYLSTVGDLRYPLLPAVLLFGGGVGLAMAGIFGLGASALFAGAFGLVGVGWVVVHVHRTDAFDDGAAHGWYAYWTLAALAVYLAAVYALFGGESVGSAIGHFAGFLPGFLLALVVLGGFSLARPDHRLALDTG